MPLSGFPDTIEVTLGSVWADKNGLGTNDVIQLSRIGETDEWSEDGTDTPDTTDNRIKFTATVNPGWSPPYYYHLAYIKMASGGSWTFGGRVSYMTSGDSVYTFKEVWNNTTGMVMAYGFSPYGNGFWTNSFPSYNSDIFSSLAEGGVAAPTGLSATDGTVADQVDLSWDNVADVTWNVYRHTSDDFSGASQIESGVATNSYSDTSVTNYTQYYFWVKAVSGGDESDPSDSDSGWSKSSSAITASAGASSGWKGADTERPPSTLALDTEETALSSAELTDVNTDDSNTVSSRSGTVDTYSAHRFDLPVESAESLKYLKLTAKGFGEEIEGGYNFYIWNLNTTSWDLLSSHTTTSKATLQHEMFSSFSDYEDSGVVHLLLIAPAKSEVLDDFEDGNITEYSGDTGSFSVLADAAQEGSYGLKSTASGGIRRTDVTVSQGDIITFQWYPFAYSSDGISGFLFGVQDADNYYRAMLQYRNGTTFYLRKVVSGSPQNLDIKANFTWSQAWSEVKLVWETNGDITMSWDKDSETLAVNDTTFTSGGIGFDGDGNLDAYFDYVRRGKI